MYTILVNDDNTLSVTQRTRIMQRSTGFDAIRFLVNPEYKGYAMAECTLTLRYKTPVSGELKSERLVLCEELYNGFLQYILPVDTKLTHEAGNIVCNLTFTYADVDTEGKPVIRVRKLNDAKITINAITDWDALIPDDLLSSLDQRIIMQDKQIKQLAEVALLLDNEKADGLKYVSNKLQLTANGNPIGNQVYIQAGTSGEYPDYSDGIPVVDFSDMNISSLSEGYSVVAF